MNPLWGNFIGVMILLLMGVFIGIWIWAWRPRHRKTFDKLAQIPMEDPTGSEAKRDSAPAVEDEDDKS